MRSVLTLAAALLLASPVFAQRIEVTIPASQASHRPPHPRHHKEADSDPSRACSSKRPTTSAQGFGVDVDDLAPNKPIVIDDKTIGYPRRSLADLDPGDYTVQAVFNVYEQFHLASGKTLWLPPDKGEGQHWNRKPGNPYNAPVKLHIDPKSHATLKLTLDKVIPPIAGTDEDPAVIAAKDADRKVAQVRPLPQRKAEQILGPRHVSRRMGAAARRLRRASRRALSPGRLSGPLPPRLRRSAPLGHNAAAARHANARAAAGYKFFQDWTAGRLPRVILLYVQSPNPYYDDSYDVDSANVGPYGSAINEELIPAIEKKYRGIGQGWARATYGGSTGGWESLATQVFYPDMYNGTYTACPDPIDFHAYQNIDLYNDTNAFVRKGDFGEMPIAADRKPDGSIIADTGDEYRYEYVLGTHGRSTEQWDIWQAVFSPAGPDGYPTDVIDPLTGAIDKSTVAYWHDHYDLTAILQRDWPTLGPKLEGKLHLAVGDGDTYFLNNAVHLLQSSSTTPATPTPTRPSSTAPACLTATPAAPPSTPCSRTTTPGPSASFPRWSSTCSKPLHPEPTPKAGATKQLGVE